MPQRSTSRIATRLGSSVFLCWCMSCSSAAAPDPLAMAGAPSASGGSTPNGTGGTAADGGVGGVTHRAGAANAGGAANTAGAANSAAGSAGQTASVGGSAGQTGSACKRGVASNTAPSAASPELAFWYNWDTSAKARAGLEFVPMIWGTGALTRAIPSEAKFLLGFNEPNFHAQANLTAQQAAAAWPALEAKASANRIPLVSPALNFCGPASDCNGTNPYQYLRDFFAACSDCQVDYVAVHWYNCDLPSLIDYLEPGGALEGFEQFGKPIWLTEFSCDPSASVAAQEAFMRAAVPYLEAKRDVFRYAWFSADPIPNAKLFQSDGSATALGKVYLSLASRCQ